MIQIWVIDSLYKTISQRFLAVVTRIKSYVSFLFFCFKNYSQSQQQNPKREKKRKSGSYKGPQSSRYMNDDVFSCIHGISVLCADEDRQLPISTGCAVWDLSLFLSVCLYCCCVINIVHMRHDGGLYILLPVHIISS